MGGCLNLTLSGSLSRSIFSVTASSPTWSRSMKTEDRGSTVALATGFLKDHVKIVLFILFNSTLPLSYLLTDSITSFDSHIGRDALWSGTKLILMWNPLLLRCLSFAFKFSKSASWDKKYNFRAKEEKPISPFSNY